MTIPEYPNLMQPVLHLNETSREVPFAPLLKSVGARLGLTAEELAAPLPSGKDTVFANRLQWALAYLERSGEVEARRGRYRPARSESETRQPESRAAGAQTAAATVTDPVAAISANARIARERLRRERSSASMPSRRSSSSA